ncbi:transcriptional regulator, TetR family [Burkholderia sp. H160]|nr:transcriptional regulator, TetR family [Burkholderia sp. H160]
MVSKIDSDPPPAAPARQRRVNGDCTRQALLSAAVALWSEQGIECVTMNGVAQRAKKTRGTVYHHFADRDALVQATRTYLDTVLGRLFSDDHKEFGDPFDVFPGLAADNPELMRSYVRSMLDRSPRENPLVQRAIRYFELLRMQGRIRPGIDATQAALSIFSLWFAAVLSVSLGQTPAERRLQVKKFKSTARHMVYRSLVYPRPADDYIDEA